MDGFRKWGNPCRMFNAFLTTTTYESDLVQDERYNEADDRGSIFEDSS